MFFRAFWRSHFSGFIVLLRSSPVLASLLLPSIGSPAWRHGIDPSRANLQHQHQLKTDTCLKYFKSHVDLQDVILHWLFIIFTFVKPDNKKKKFWERLANVPICKRYFCFFLVYMNVKDKIKGTFYFIVLQTFREFTLECSLNHLKLVSGNVYKTNVHLTLYQR